MTRIILLFGFCCSLLLVIGCEGEDTITPPVDEVRTLTLEGEPVYALYTTDMDWVRQHYSDTYSVPYNNVGWERVPSALEFEWMPFWMIPEAATDTELVDSNDGIIRVEITGCPNGHTWDVSCSDPDYLRLIEENIVKTSEATYDVSYTYKILMPGKGYIGFKEIYPSDWGGPRERGMGIIYTCVPIEELYVEINSITWFYEIHEWGSSVSAMFSGRTNAHKLLTRGSGGCVLGPMQEISIDSEGVFSSSIYASRLRYDEFLHGDSRIYVIGTIGLPKVVELVNPLDE